MTEPGDEKWRDRGMTEPGDEKWTEPGDEK